MSLLSLINPTFAEQHLTEDYMNRIEAEANILIQSMAEMKERCEIALNHEKMQKHLTDNQKFNLMVFAGRMSQYATEITDIQKNL
jgi:hypothetical protein